MKVEIHLYARARELAGDERITVEVPEGARVDDLRRAMARAHPGLRSVAGSLLFAVDNEYASGDAVIDSITPVTCFPPVSGG